MHKLKSLSPTLVVLLFHCGAAFAQRRAGEPSDAEACAACGTCGAGMGVMVLVPIILFALNIALLVWVARDAKARGMDSAVLWMLLVFFTSLIGLIIYLFSRPQGNLVRCPSCGNNRLQASARCPHCGNV
jgi:uncharacterized membrane protein YhaH (DUF805 family)